MDFDVLSRQISDTYGHLSPQLQLAARYVLDRPEDVGLMSMRKVAQAAGVQPATMVRFAQALGFEGYETFRQPFRERLRPGGLTQRAKDVQRRSKTDKEPGLLEDVFDADVANLAATFEANDAARLSSAADRIANARKVYVLGLRSCYPVAFYFHYVYGLFREGLVLLDGQGGTFADSLRDIREGDLLLAVSFSPYTKLTVRAMAYARERGAECLAISDSRLSPFAEQADDVLVVRSESLSVFQSIAASMALVEALVTLLIGKGGRKALKSIEDSERHLADFGAYWQADSTLAKRKLIQDDEPLGKSVLSSDTEDEA
ncbi:MAG: MurR/RpiR family transcriptional regulator [Magnetovibrionaceae bacterium]